MNRWSIPLRALFEELEASPKGLTEEEAKIRLSIYGPNEIGKEKGISPLKILLRQFTDMFIIILLIAALITAIVNEGIDALLILVVVLLNAVLGFIQEYRAEKAIEALRKMTALHVTTLRSGKFEEIESVKVVPGDVIALVEGEKVPADCRLIESSGLEADESMLTGESTPVAKRTIELVDSARLAERTNMLFASTTVVRGHGRAIVVSTGMNTEVGKIAKLINVPSPPTPLQNYMKRFARKLGVLIAVICVLLFVIGSYVEENMLTLFLASVSLAAAAIPEGLPAIVTLSLALGARKMAAKNALVKRLSAVESLGSATVICTDKTGTLTENKMAVQKIYHDGKIIDIKKAKPDLLFRIGLLCNNSVLEKIDPTEVALLESAKAVGIHDKEFFEYKRKEEIPFSSKSKMMAVLCEKDEEDFVYVKGASHVVLPKCVKILENGKIRKMTAADRKKIEEAVDTLAADALRVLAFAYKKTKGQKLDEELIFVGLQGMMDPPRKEVREAIGACESAGIKIIVITGDHALTAKAVAEDIGLKIRNIMTGDEIERLSFDALKEKVRDTTIFARIEPYQKSLIVKALEANGEIVAVTGDGVNDAPALKIADIGIAMGIRGTDVAKEAADMIITDDNFATIVLAVQEGRRIFDNIKKSMIYLLSSNLGEVLTVLFSSLLLLPLPMTAAQILWINLVSDGFPALALGVDPAHPRVMKRKPDKYGDKMLNTNMLLAIMRTGILIGIACLFLYMFFLATEPLKAHTVVFTGLVMIEFLILQTVRQQYGQKLFGNKYLSLSIALVVLLQLIIIYSPINVLFHSVPLDLHDWSVIIAAIAIVFVFNHFLNKFIKSE